MVFQFFTKMEQKNSPVCKNLRQELKKQFQLVLNKLGQIDTLEVGIRDARTLVDRNESLEAIQIFM